MAAPHLGEVGAVGVEVVAAGRSRSAASPSECSTVASTSPCRTVSPTRDGDAEDGAAGGERDDVLHLHRLQDEDRSPGLRPSRRPSPRRRRRCRGPAPGGRPRPGRGGLLGVPPARRTARPAATSVGGPVVDERGGGPPGEDVGVGEDGAEEAGVGGDAADVDLGERPVEVAEGVAEVALPLVDDDLGQQRVVARALLGAGAGRGVDPDAGAAGEGERGDRAGGRDEGAVGGDGLGVDAGLDRPAERSRCAVGEAEVGEGRAGGDAQLQRARGRGRWSPR